MKLKYVLACASSYGCRRNFFCALAIILATFGANGASAQPIINFANSAGDNAARFDYAVINGIQQFRSRGVILSQHQPDALPQPISIDFAGSLSANIDIPSGAQIIVDDVLPSGFPSNTPQLASQPTNGGTFRIYSDRNLTQLLLAGNLHQGLLYQTNTNLAIVAFDAPNAVITGGILAGSFSCGLANLSIKLDNIDDCVITSKACLIRPMCWSGQNCLVATPTPVPTPRLLTKFTAKLVSGQVLGICLDCAGVPNGGKVVDQCGVCGGNNSCKDCLGIINGPNRYDSCGVCNGNNSCIDCAGIPNGGKVRDLCGVCGGNNSTCKDCAGTPNGGKKIDLCGICGGNNSCIDCAGVPYGGKVRDACGICGGNGSTCRDCAGVIGGNKVVDACGICGGDGSTCKPCDENNIGELIRQLDTGVDAIKKFTQSITKILRSTRGQLNTADQKLVSESENLFNEAWRTLNIKIPTIILVCPATSICAEVSHAAAIQDYQRISGSMNDIAGTLAQRLESLLKQQVAQGRLESAVANQRSRRAKALRNNADKQDGENQAAAATIPPSTRVCS